ncbi:hypothetical protein Taro_038766 [Colocasia esculenta]|uniref:Uncharacterized protein n=1 Tax=Colocasia esculenta TaxID=4460 RepID=A0A843WGT2_COLES|nr:hypothetical protein [Colocasia esculenta]
MAKSLAVKILSWRQMMLPLTPLNGVRSRLSSRPRYLRVLYFPHRHQWIMECSCRV